ncbi:hypothetical protein, partial [Variovorax sp. UMC13]|uniref:hypothetical protein n=1 Tax=Variovorax sp. UMC13 TaxID=1862326 RepID=UPI0015FF42CE
MNAKTLTAAPSIDPDDIGHNTTQNPEFNDLIAARLSRRKLFGLGVGTAGAALQAEKFATAQARCDQIVELGILSGVMA